MILCGDATNCAINRSRHGIPRSQSRERTDADFPQGRRLSGIPARAGRGSGTLFRGTVHVLLLPNHWHLVVRPGSDDALGRWLGWVGVTHVRRYHEHYHSRGGGHLYQGRFKSFPVAEDDYFLTLCRYVEANALRAGLVEAPRNGAGAGCGSGLAAADLPLAAWPLERPRDWLARVNRGLKAEQLDGIRTCVQRGRPLGPENWVQRTAARLGLEFTLRSAGQPRKTNNQ